MIEEEIKMKHTKLWDKYTDYEGAVLLVRIPMLELLPYSSRCLCRPINEILSATSPIRD